MKILALVTPASGDPGDDLSTLATIGVEAFLKASKEGVLREFYFSQSPAVLALFLETEDLATARAELSRYSLPASCEVAVIERVL